MFMITSTSNEQSVAHLYRVPLLKLQQVTCTHKIMFACTFICTHAISVIIPVNGRLYILDPYNA